MPRACSICKNPKRAWFEKAAAKGESIRNIAKRFDISYPALQRHIEHCVEKAAIIDSARALVALKGPLAPEDLPKFPNAYRDLMEIRETLREAQEAQKKRKNIWVTLALSKERRGLIEQELKVFESQQRLEAQYSISKPFEISRAYKFLRSKYPKVLKEMVQFIEEDSRP